MFLIKTSLFSLVGSVNRALRLPEFIPRWKGNYCPLPHLRWGSIKKGKNKKLWTHNQRKTLLLVLWIRHWSFQEIIDVPAAFFTQKTFIHRTSDQQRRDVSMPFSVSLPWVRSFFFFFVIEDRLYPVEQRSWSSPPTAAIIISTNYYHLLLSHHVFVLWVLE